MVESARNQSLTGLECTELYSGFENREKILGLLHAWLFFTEQLHRCYGAAGLQAYMCGRPRSHVRFSQDYEFRQSLEQSVGNHAFPLHFLWPRTGALTLTGAPIRSLQDKIKLRYSRCLVSGLKCNADNGLLEKLIASLEQGINLLPNLELSTEVISVIKKLRQSIPKVFWSRPIKMLNQSPINVRLAASSFFEFDGSENILLLQRRILITGYQHGGGYDMFKDDFFGMMEKNLCDSFLGWGFSEFNQRQHRFNILGRNKDIDVGVQPRSVIWVERPRLPSFMTYITETNARQCSDSNVIEYIYSELSGSQLMYSHLAYPGILRSPDYDSLRKNELVPNGPGETVLNQNTVCVFDLTGATLIHHCIDFGVPFCVVVNSGILPKLTSSAREWLNILVDSNLAFFESDAGSLRKQLKRMVRPGYRSPESVRGYHDRYFFQANNRELSYDQ